MAVTPTSRVLLVLLLCSLVVVAALGAALVFMQLPPFASYMRFPWAFVAAGATALFASLLVVFRPQFGYLAALVAPLLFALVMFACISQPRPGGFILAGVTFVAALHAFRAHRIGT